MSTRPSERVPDSHIDWDVERITESGTKYRVGKPSPGGGSHETLESNLIACVNVHWAVTNRWEPTTKEIIDKVYITAYNLDDGGTIFTYRISINTLRNHGKYTFTDDSGDVYELGINMSGVHYVDYNSRAPAIVGVCYNPAG